MVENRPFLTFLTHAFLICGFVVVAFPVYVALIASTPDSQTLMSSAIPLLPGSHFLENYRQIFTDASAANGLPSYPLMAMNSLVMAVVITVGKIVISILSAFAIVYFRFRLRMDVMPKGRRPKSRWPSLGSRIARRFRAICVANLSRRMSSRTASSDLARSRQALVRKSLA